MAGSDALTPDERHLWTTWMRAHRLLAREVERRLQTDFGISKAEFSVLVTLLGGPDGGMNPGDLAEALCWEKSRVSHQLTRMERSAHVVRTRSGASGRRAGVGLTPEGRALAERAAAAHLRNIRRLFFDVVAPEQRAAIRAWSERTIADLGSA